MQLDYDSLAAEKDCVLNLPLYEADFFKGLFKIKALSVKKMWVW